MRTVILIGLMLVADAIIAASGRKPEDAYPEKTVSFVGWVMIVAILMDLATFLAGILASGG